MTQSPSLMTNEQSGGGTDRPTPHGMTGKRNAAKPEARTSMISVRVSPREKAGYVKAAGGAKLHDWVRDTLNAAASKP